MSKLDIKNLHVAVEGNEILKGIDLTINTNEMHVIMGPNGAGKSTLGEPLWSLRHEVTDGSITLDGEDVPLWL